MPHADLLLTGGKIVTLDPRSCTVSALAIRGDRPTENTSALQACLARLSGEVTVGFSCWNLLQGSDQFPAPFFLEAYREITRHPTADYTELLESLPS